MSLRKTNIPELDESLEGGLKHCTITLLWSHPGIESPPFVYHAMMEALVEGDYCIYVTCSKNASTVEEDMRHYGRDMGEYLRNGRLIFLDAYSGLIDRESTEKFFVKDARNAKAITETLASALKKTQGTHTLVIHDSISTLIDHCGEESIKELAAWKDLFAQNNATGFFIFTEWPYDEEVLQRLKARSDAVIHLKAVENKVIKGEYFTVSKLSWSRKERPEIRTPFKITPNEGINILKNG